MEKSDNIIQNIRMEALTDEALMELGKGAVENAEDYNLKFKHYPPYRKGLFDNSIFGSLNVCKCGATTTPGLVCPMCGGKVLTKSEASKRMGHYKLTFPFVSQYKIKHLCDELVEFHPEFSKFTLNNKGTKVSGIKGLLKSLYNAKIVYTPIEESEISSSDLIVYDSNGALKVTVEYFNPKMVDESLSNWGPMGLRNFALNYRLPKHVEKSVNFILKYVNQVFLLLPITKRPAIIRKDSNGKPSVSLHGVNTYYRAIINTDQQMYDILNGAKTLADKLTVVYSMNRMIDYMYNSYDITASSKESLVRNELTGTIKRSGRSNIVGATDVPVDTVKIPRQMAYECLKTEVIEALKEKGVRDPITAYLNPSSETMKMFEEMVSKYCVLMLRNPTLSKTNVSAFKVVLWDEISLGLPIFSVQLFNADFDGDQMAFFWITDPHMVKLALERMGPKRNWRFVKDNSFVFKFQIAGLQGLYVATQVRQYDNPIKYFTSIADMERAYENNEIEVDEIVDMFGKRTTYGREKISDIIKVDLDELIGKTTPISAKTVGKILKVLETQEDGIERHNELTKFAGHISTYSGNTTVSIEDISQMEIITPEIERILKSNSPDSVKFRKLQSILSDEMMKQVESLDNKNILNIIQGAGKIKKDNLPALFGPRFEYSRENGLVVFDNSISTGFDEGAFLSHVKENREILGVKKTGTPTGGYLGRQLINVCNYFTYTEEPSSSKNGIVAKAKDVQGRIKLNGSIVNESGDTLVRVKSCVDSSSNKVSREELSTTTEALLKYNEDDGIGTDMAMALSEPTTQSLLGLKHGGALISPSKETLKSITSGKVLEVGSNFILVENNGVKYKYYKPQKVVLSEHTTGQQFPQGSILAYEDKEIHVEMKLASINALIDSFSKTEHVKREEVNRSYCYAPCDGIIVYNLDKEKKTIKIGSCELPLNEEEIYYYPEGYKVNKGDKICGGIVNIDEYRDLFNNDVGWLFYIFKDQFETIIGKGLISEVFEVVFKGINYMGKFSVRQAARKPKQLMNKLNLGYTKEAIREFVGQPIGESFLSDLLLMDIKDDVNDDAYYFSEIVTRKYDNVKIKNNKFGYDSYDTHIDYSTVDINFDN